VVCIGKSEKVLTEIWWGNLRATDHLKYLYVNGIILKWIFNK